MDIPLQLRHRPRGTANLTSVDRIAGILLPGNSPADLLRTVTHWGLHTDGLSLLVLHDQHSTNMDRPNMDGPDGESPSVPKIAGAILIGSSIPESRSDFERRIRERATIPVLPLFYRCVADRLYLPLEADLVPQLSESEVRNLLPSDPSCLMVWHPSLGLIQFEAEQIPKVSDLLRGPVVSEVRWDGARFGETLNDRIRSLTAEEPESLSDIIQQGQEDIGSDSKNISNAPPSPDEVANPRLNDLLRSIQRLIAKGILGFTNKLSERPGGSQSLARLHQWAASFFSNNDSGMGAGQSELTPKRPAHNLSTQRENELKRLLHLLENDPDQGLKYALPLHGHSNRGSAAPSGRLGERTPNFDLRQLTGSGPADAWDLPWEYHTRLLESYRELAQREMRLGNHRRAAYIYATLLNDLNSAASALEAGGLHRDAATIYQKHLNNPLKAAQCLRDGGFWEDALVIYQDRGRWIDAGELLLQLEQPEEARRMFSNEVSSCEARRDFLNAGNLSDVRLEDPLRAATYFKKGWQLNTAAENCFRALLDLHGRRGLHAEARVEIRNLTDSPNLMVHQHADAIRVCSDTAINYPDAAVRDVARQQTWMVASAILSEKLTDQHPIALKAIRSLARQDELLQRDVQRFASQTARVENTLRKNTPPKKARGVPQPRSNVRPLVPKGTVRLSPANAPLGTKWMSGVTALRKSFVMGLTPNESLLIVELSTSRVETKIYAGNAFILRGSDKLSLGACQFRASGIASRVFVQHFPAPPDWNTLALQQIAGNIANNFVSVHILSPPNGLLLDFIQLPSGSTWTLEIDMKGRLSIQVLGLKGLARQTLILDLEGTELAHFEDALYRVHHHGKQTIIVTGRHVWRTDSFEVGVIDKSGEIIVKPTEVIDFPESPHSMVASLPNTTLRLAFSFSDGAQAIWPLTNESCAFASHMKTPLLTCTGNGLFVAACQSSGRIECYRLNSGTAELVADMNISCGTDRLVSLFPASQGNEFFTLYESGAMERLQIPVR